MKTIKRIISIIIDILIMNFVIYMIARPINLIIKDYTINVILNTIFFVLCLYFFIYKDSIWGYESIGKKIMGLKIYQNGERIIDKKILVQRIKTTYIYFFISGPMLVLTGKTEADMKYNTEVR